MCNQLKDELLHLLCMVKETYKSLPPGYGICAGIKSRAVHSRVRVGKEMFYVLHDVFKTWPHYSGDPDYPVPSTDPTKSQRQMFTFYHDCWDQQTEYGRLRMSLLDHCIATLESQ